MAATLEPLIERYILPGSHIMSDGWASYANIGNIRNAFHYRTPEEFRGSP